MQCEFIASLASFRPTKKISVFCVTILGRVGTHIFLIFWGDKYIFMHFERHFAFKMHKIIFFSENLKKNLGFTSKLR